MSKGLRNNGYYSDYSLLGFSSRQTLFSNTDVALWKGQSHVSSELLRATLSTWFSHTGRCCLLFAYDFFPSPPKPAPFSVSLCPVCGTWSLRPENMIPSPPTLFLTLHIFVLHIQALPSDYILSLITSQPLHYPCPSLIISSLLFWNFPVLFLVLLLPQWFPPRLFLISSLTCLKLYWLLISE